jgi:hypothetical protein
VRSFPKAVDKQRKVVGRKCAAGDGDVAGNTIQHDDDENKKPEQCSPPEPPVIITNSSNNDDIGSPPATAHLVAPYMASYWEGGRLCYLSTIMVFTSLQPTGRRGFAIDGSGSDSDGTCNIIEGRMAPDGQAYWIEQQGSRKILSTGVFTTTAKTTSSSMTVDSGIDEDAGTAPVFFHGQWRSSNGVAAKYINFALDQTNQKQQPVAVVTTASTTATTATTANTMHQEHDIESGAVERAPAAAA